MPGGQKEKENTWVSHSWKGNCDRDVSTYTCPEKISLFFIHHKHLRVEIYVFYGDV